MAKAQTCDWKFPRCITNEFDIARDCGLEFMPIRTRSNDNLIHVSSPYDGFPKLHVTQAMKSISRLEIGFVDKIITVSGYTNNVTVNPGPQKVKYECGLSFYLIK